jgi:FdhD protein
MPERPGPVESRSARRWRAADGAAESISRDLPTETAVGLAYDSAPYVVVMASPTDIEDLAVGFTVTERVAPYAAIQRVTVSVAEEGLLADVLLSKTAGAALAVARRRTLESRSSCGLCGVETLKEAVRSIAKVGEGPTVRRAAIQRALAALEAGQTLGARTRATHAAAWASADGEVLLVREDVGRHNALDKLVGAALRAGLDPRESFIVVTSRCSYEMVAISAPTSLAIAQAEAAGMTLVALARPDGHTVFVGDHRIASG